jgi:hypothetical protein
MLKQMGKGRDKRKRVANRKEHRLRKLEAIPDEPPPSSPDDFDALVFAPLKPRPYSSSGAIALNEPEEPEDDSAIGYRKNH